MRQHGAPRRSLAAACRIRVLSDCGNVLNFCSYVVVALALFCAFVPSNKRLVPRSTQLAACRQCRQTPHIDKRASIEFFRTPDCRAWCAMWRTTMSGRCATDSWGQTDGASSSPSRSGSLQADRPIPSWSTHSGVPARARSTSQDPADFVRAMDIVAARRAMLRQTNTPDTSRDLEWLAQTVPLLCRLHSVYRRNASNGRRRFQCNVAQQIITRVLLSVIQQPRLTSSCLARRRSARRPLTADPGQTLVGSCRDGRNCAIPMLHMLV
jgi:hypothetical protein